MPPTRTPRRSKARSTCLWMRLKQKPFKTTIIPPDTGQSIIPIPNAWPQPELPLWRDLEYRSKLPLPSWHKWTLCCGPMNHGYIPKWPGAVFDTWDINVHVYDTEYHPLHDPALRIFCFNRWKTLLRQNLITPDGQVKATLRQFNQWRRHLSRHQHQLMVKKQAIARRDELCDTIRGFMHVLNRTSLDKPLRKEAVDVTDEEADALYREGEEHNALLVELGKLHDLSKQVRVEILKYIRNVNQERAKDKERMRQLKLLTTMYAKEQEVLVRRYYQKVVLFAEKRKQKAASLLERRLQSQTADGKKAEEMKGKIQIRTKDNVDMWRRIYRRLHEKNRPKLPSERKKRTGTVAAAEQIVAAVAEDQEAQADESQQENDAEAVTDSTEEVAKPVITTESDRTLRHIATETVDELMCCEPEVADPIKSIPETVSSTASSFEDLAKRFLEDLLNNALLMGSQLSIHEDRTSPSTASSHANLNVAPVLVPSKQPSKVSGRDIQEKSSSNSGGSKILPRIMRSAMSKPNANNHRGSDHRHISFAPNAAADEPIKPTAKKSTDLLHRCGLIFVDETKSLQDEGADYPATNKDSAVLLQPEANKRSRQDFSNQASLREVVVGAVVVPRSEHQMQQAVYVSAKSKSRLESAGTSSTSALKQSELLPLRDNSPSISPSKERQGVLEARLEPAGKSSTPAFKQSDLLPSKDKSARVSPSKEQQGSQAARLGPAGKSSTPAFKQSDLLPSKDKSPRVSPSKEQQGFLAARLEPTGKSSTHALKQSDLLPSEDKSPRVALSKERQGFLAARSSEHQTRLQEANHSALSAPNAESHASISSQKDSLTLAGDLINELVTEVDPAPIESACSVTSRLSHARSDNSVILGQAIVDGLVTSETEIKPVSSDEDDNYVISIPIKPIPSVQTRPYAGFAPPVAGSNGRSRHEIDQQQPSETKCHSSPTLVTAADIVDDVTPSEIVDFPVSQTSLPKLRKSPTLDAALDIIDSLTSVEDMFFNIYSA